MTSRLHLQPLTVLKPQCNTSSSLLLRISCFLTTKIIMATSLLPDPRLNGAVSTYDREATIAALTEYYKALGKLPYVNEVDIIYPPPSGWPNITKENFAALEKNDEVIELLQRLPYLNNPNDWGKGYAVSFATFVIDYSSEPFGPQIDVKKAEYYSPDFAFPDEKVKPWVIPLTWSEDNVVGAYLLLDTTDGRPRP